MTEILFYHLEGARLENVLPELLEKTLAKGWKAVVRVGSLERIKALDAHLWTYRDEAFLPHGSGGGESANGTPEGDAHESASRQPIWLTDGSEVPNGAEVLFLVEGGDLALEELDQFTRCVTIFDGGQEAAVNGARVFWKAAREAGHEATYWRQSAQGRWEKQG